MSSDESIEERRARLKAIAMARVARLVSGKPPQPYPPLSKEAIAKAKAAEKEAISLAREREEVRARKEAAAKKALEGAIKERDKRIENEIFQFRDVLERKFKQLVFLDEYETLDYSIFISELNRFALRRLPDLDANLIVERAMGIVPIWMLERRDATMERMFNSDMTPLEYERFCATLLESAGWNIRLTKASGDQGADIICDSVSMRMVVQCKLYTSSVGNSAVQQVISAREFESAGSAAVVSNSNFTKSAKDLANVANVLLLHHEQLPSLSPESLGVKLRNMRKL